ncbi:hypothetical protein Tco_0961202 [Tanacetum coccineum]
MLELRSASHKEKKYIKSPWMLSSYLLAIPHSRSLLKSQKSTCINFGLPSRRSEIQMHTTSSWKRSSESIRKSFVKFFRYVPKFLNQDFIAPPLEEELVTFIQELGYSGRCNMLSAIHTDQMHQPWRTFVAIINRCISRKTTGLDSLRESQAQILWGMYNKKNVDYVALLWEDFMYQANNREISSARKEHMPYPRFTKVIINHFISKDKTISMRNMINLYIIHDDSLLGTLKFVSKTQDHQQYGALIPDDMINQDIKDSTTYKTYYDVATRKVSPRKVRKYKKVASPTRKLSPVKEAEHVEKDKRVKRHSWCVCQLKEAINKSKKDYHISQASGLGDGTNFESRVPDEQQHKTSSTDEGTGTKLGVLDVPTYDFESENESCGDSEDDNDDDSDDDNKGDDDKADSDNDGNSDADDNERTYSDDDDENSSFTLKDYDEEEHDDEYESDDDYENMFEEEDDDDLYKDVDNVSQELSYEQVIEDAHVTLTALQKTDGSKQSSSVSSDFASKFLILENVSKAVDEVSSMMHIKKTATAHATTVSPTISMITPPPQLTTPSPAPTTVPTTTSIPALPGFSSLFGFDQGRFYLRNRVSASLAEFELNKILIDKLEKSKSYRAAKEHKNLYVALIKSYQLDKESLQLVCKDVEPPRSSKSKDSQSSSSKGTKSQSKSSGKSAQVEEPVFETADTEMPQDQRDDMGNTEDQPNVKTASKHDWHQRHRSDIMKSSKGILQQIFHVGEDQTLHKFKEGDFPRLNLRDIEDLLLLLVQKKLSNLEKDVIFDLNVALQISDISKMTPYTAYKNPQGIIYQDTYKRNRLMRLDELYKFCDERLTSVRNVLHDIANNLRMEYLPKRKWCNLERKRSRLMIKAIDQ